MEGLQSVIYVKVSDAEFVGIPIWESKEAFENAQGQVQELMSMFKDDMTGRLSLKKVRSAGFIPQKENNFL